MKKWHWNRFFSEFISFPLLIIIPPLLHTHLSPPHEVRDSPDQTAHYHTLGPKLGASSLTQHSAGLRVKFRLQIYIGVQKHEKTIVVYS
jgi:hypothetical protein